MGRCLAALLGADAVRQVLGADDLLPIFIYVFVFSELSHPDDVADCLWKLCHPDALRGESGYFLTLLESTVCYLRELSV